MLRVHGDYLRPLLPGSGHDDVPGADQGLLVGQGYALSLVYGRQGGSEPHGAGHGGDHAVRLLQGGGLDEALHAGAHTDVRVRHGSLESLCRLPVVHRHEGRVQPPGLLFQHIYLPVCGESGHPYAGVLRHGNGLPAYGAGAAQYGYGFYHNIFLFIYTNYS